MKCNNIMIHSKILYIFFVILSLNIFFFSTTKVLAKSFEINDIEISKPFENNFNKNSVINISFCFGFLVYPKIYPHLFSKILALKCFPHIFCQIRNMIFVKLFSISRLLCST